MIIYEVENGDTPSKIADRFNVSLLRLLSDNGLDEFTKLSPGQVLVIQIPDVVHTVSAGETLYEIANNYSTNINDIFRNNYILRGSESIYPGQTLVISYDDVKTREESVDINAYSYTFIGYNLLRETMPYLTFLTPFTYGINDNGTLITPDDEWMIELSNNFDVKPLMHLSTLNEQGVFSNETASNVFNNEDVKNRLTDEIVKNLYKKGYYGLDIDFEFINPDESVLYTQLIDDIRAVINPLGFDIIAALAPKTSDEQKGTLYEGHNYGLIGEAANYVLLMTYEWGYTYGPPMAVAPVDKVREVVDYAVSKIPSGKIFLGIPTYGYDWTLPYVKGVSRAPSISNGEALKLASEFGAEIKYNEISQAPWFNYKDYKGEIHEVWFEDARSIKAKFDIINEYNLAGAGYWDLLRPFPQNWVLLNSYFNINNY